MSQSDPVSPPPPYRPTDTSSSRFSGTNGTHPPPYRAPTSYSIGTTRLDAPLVDVGQLKAHLALLRAFKALKVKVDERSAEELPAVVNELDKEKRWAWFVGLAVERYVIRVRSIVPFRIDFEHLFLTGSSAGWSRNLLNLISRNGSSNAFLLSMYLWYGIHTP